MKYNKKNSHLMFLSILLLLLLACVSCGGGDEAADGDSEVADGDGEVADGDGEVADGDTDVDVEQGSEVASKFFMGYSEVEVTPDDGICLGGYGFGPMRRKEGVHDPLMAQVAFFMNDIKQAYVIVSIDNVGYAYEFDDWGPGVKILRETAAEKLAGKIAIDPQAITIASSHSHYSTDLTGFWQETGTGPDKEMLAEHVEMISEAIVEAYESAQEIKLYFGETAMDPDYAMRDRLDPKDLDSEPCCGNEMDPTVSLIQAQDLEGNPLVTIANYANHPTTCPWESKLTSADYIYGFREEMMKKTGAPAMFLQGFEAAVHAGPKMIELGPLDNFDTAYAFGAVFADNVEAGLATLTENTSYEIMHKWTNFNSIVGPESQLVFMLENFDMPKRSITEVTGEDGETLYQLDGIEVSWHKFGDAEFALYPGEGTPPTSLFYRSKMVSPYKFLISLANDSAGYFIEQYDLDNDPTGRLVDYELTMGIGYNGGPDARAAMDSLNWYDGAWQEEEAAE